MSTVTAKPTTAQELQSRRGLGPCELIYGELVMMSPVGVEHAVVVARLSRWISDFVDEHENGITLTGEPGFKIESEPDLVRAPDVSVIRKNRLAASYPGDISMAFPTLQWRWFRQTTPAGPSRKR